MSDSREKILVVEDDRSLREGLVMNLELHGFEVLAAADGEEGMQLAFDARPDLIVLDIMLPQWSGLEILKALRQEGEEVPVLVLSAKGSTPDKVAGLEIGADDYMTKPFDLPELLARIGVMLRRRQREEQSEKRISHGEIEIDPASRQVVVAGQTVALSAKEFDLLLLLMKSPSQVFTRDAILQHVWGWDYEGTERTVDNFIVRLRKKLGGRRGKELIETVPKVGYKLG